MPNWCENTLNISGESNELENFYLENRNYDNEKNEELDFLKSVPMPENVLQGNLSLQERQLNPNNWYDWNITNLGTKWNVSDAYYTKNENEIIYEFLTAWSPPTSWLEKTADKYPNLIFKMKYCEESMGFAGEIVLHGSVIVKYEEWDPNEEWDYYDENKEVIDELILNYYNLKMTNYIELNENEKKNLINDILGDLYEEGYQSLSYDIIENFIINSDQIN
tara:strand:+ start:37 stop:699 length:663 start_codon:yes stop_codon:yes gene_type:complete